MSWITEPFSNEFMVQALLAGILAVITTSLVGTWVILRGLSFMGDAMAHGVLPGIALAFIWDFDLTIGAVLSAMVTMKTMSTLLVYSVRGKGASRAIQPIPNMMGMI